LTTSVGNEASSATWIPKLWSQTPIDSGWDRSAVISRSPLRLRLTRLDLVQQGDLLASEGVGLGIDVSDDVEVLDVRDLLSECGELVEVGGEEDRSAGLGGEVSVSVEEGGNRGLSKMSVGQYGECRRASATPPHSEMAHASPKPS
jgi:hypothetical protein